MRNEFQNAVVPKYFDVKRMGGQVGLDHSVHDYKDGWNKLGHKIGASWDVLVGKDAGKFWGSNSKGQVWNNLYANRTARINSQQRSRELAVNTIANGQLNHSSPVMAAAGFTGFDAGYNQAKIVGAIGFQALEDVALTVATGGVLKVASLAIKGVMSAGRIGMGAIRSTRLGRRAAAYRRLKFGRGVTSSRGAGGVRSPVGRIITPEEIKVLENEIIEIGGDLSVFRFNEGSMTAYDDIDDLIRLRGNVFPVTYESTHPRSIMSTKATLAHELGHRNYRHTRVPVNHWKDEMRASLYAAKHVTGLTIQDRTHLILDAMERVKEGTGLHMEPKDWMVEILYGYSG